MKTWGFSFLSIARYLRRQECLCDTAKTLGRPRKEVHQFNVDEDAQSSRTGKISQEDRRKLINKQIEKKRRNHSEYDETGDAFGEGAYEDDGGGGVGGAQQYYNGAEYQEDGWGQGSATRRTLTRNTAEDSYSGHDARTNRIVQAEAVIHEMFKDCTFRPKIKDLPAYYGGEQASSRLMVATSMTE